MGEQEMTKYRIKNHEIEKAVSGLFKTKEAFENRLNEQCDLKWDTDWNRGCSTIHITINKTESVTGHQCGVTLNKFDIEEVLEYNPNDWNHFPTIKPPHFGYYLVTQVGGQVRSAEYVQTLDGDPGSHYFDTHWDVPGVIAFRELPKAYEGEK